MKPLPNALRQELARSQSAGPHPDADLLTAFSENSLIGRERDQVLAHLAQCTRCRAIVHLAEAPPSETSPAAAPSRSTRRLWVPFFAAAGIAVAATVTVIVLRRPAPPAPPATVEIARNTQPAAPPLKTASRPPAPLPLAKKAPHAHPSNPAVPQAKSEAAQNTVVQTEAVADLDLVQPQQQFQKRTLEQAPSQQAGLARDLKSKDTPSINGFADAAPAEARKITPEAVRAHWRLSPGGRVERAIGEGPWQTVLATPGMRVISVSGSDVWAGGDGLQLVHSADNGNTWIPITLPPKTTRTHAVVHIHLQSASSLTVEADDGSTWATADGGVTWQ